MSENVKDEITQTMHDLYDRKGFNPCKSDCEALRKAIKPYGVRNLENIFYHDNNATTRSTYQTLSKIRALFKENPDKNYTVIHLYAGHGMIASGRQVVLLNQFNKHSRFYKWLGVE